MGVHHDQARFHRTERVWPATTIPSLADRPARLWTSPRSRPQRFTHDFFKTFPGRPSWHRFAQNDHAERCLKRLAGQATRGRFAQNTDPNGDHHIPRLGVVSFRAFPYRAARNTLGSVVATRGTRAIFARRLKSPWESSGIQGTVPTGCRPS